MAKYRKKPVVIEAVRWTGSNRHEIIQFCPHLSHRKTGEFGETGLEYIAPKASIYIKTLEGVFEARPGDWIIKGIKGEIYACKPDIFEETYEPA